MWIFFESGCQIAVPRDVDGHVTLKRVSDKNGQRHHELDDLGQSEKEQKD